MTVFLGLEKIDDAGLSSVNKSNSAANNDRAIEILQDLDVGYTPNFIVDPDWDYEDFDKLKRWVDRTGAYNAAYSILTPLPSTDLWDEVEAKVNTKDWELFDISHTVLPTRLPIDEFYRQYAGLWRHSLDVRYRLEGKLKTNFGLLMAVATGKVSVTGLRRGVLGWITRACDPESFLTAHEGSAARLDEAAAMGL